jgi:dihydropteroate synthase
MAVHMRTVEVDGMPVGDGHPPRVMSVLNMSPASEYRPSVAVDVEQAARLVDEELVPAGGDIVDVGLQSANPKYDTEAPEVELERLDAAVSVVETVDSDVPFSIETRYAEVAEAAITRGFDLVNDVCGFADPEMPRVCEEYDVPVVKMASGPDLDRAGSVKTIDDVFEALERNGFTDRTIIDPSFGQFYDERTYEDNWEMFRRLREFRAFGRPILTATNREDFLGDLAGRPDTDEQLPVSLAAATLEVDRGAHVVRTHDTARTKDVVQVAHALAEERTRADDGLAVTELPTVGGREARRHADRRRSVAGAVDDAVCAAFLAERPPGEDVDAVREAAESAGVYVAVDEDLYLAGTASALASFLDALPARTDTLVDLAGTVRRSLARIGGS